MAYKKDLKKAARRHLTAAQVLYKEDSAGSQPGCKAVAGYLFGLAGEMAVKQILLDSGVGPRPEAERHDDPFYAHFPQLKSMLGTLPGRRALELRKLSQDPRLFQRWDISMRYAPSTEVDPAWIDAWKSSAEELLGKMGEL